MIIVGSYQGLCNLYRVFISFDYRALTPKVRGEGDACRAGLRPCACRRPAAGTTGCEALLMRKLGCWAASRPSWDPPPAQPPTFRRPFPAARQEAGHKQLGPRAAWLHFVALMCQLGISSAWLWQPTAEPFLCRAQNINVGITYALTASSLIMAHMCKEPFIPPLWAIMTLALGAVNSRLRWVDPLKLTLALDVAVFAGYLHYVISVIDQICDFLGIRCLSLQRPAGGGVAAPTNGMAAPHSKPE